MADYFVIRCNEDGDVSVAKYSREDLLQKVLNPQDPWYGTTAAFDRMPRSEDPQEWGERKLLIIKGELVVPTAVQVVQKLEIP